MDAKKRVLVIDDDGDFRTTVHAVLTAAGYEVAEAASGREGLERASALLPDLVVLDLMMEDPFAGYGVTQALRFQPAYRALQDTPILMVSAEQEDPEERFVKAGAEAAMVRPDGYFTKPLDVPSFLGAVERLAGRAARRL